MITHLLELKDYAKGFDAAMGNPRQCGKAVLFPDHKELEAEKKRMGIK
ncbi:MAG: hypothetical protein Q7U87_01010 [bacterium]|nr:hypothetical protein [bacterium]